MKGNPAIIWRPARVPVAALRGSGLSGPCGAIPVDDHQRDLRLFESKQRNAPAVMADIAAAECRGDPARLAAERGDFPDRAVFPWCGRRHIVDEGTRIGHPARLLVVGIVAGDLERRASGQQPAPDLTLAARSGNERNLLPSGEIAGDSSIPTKSVRRCSCTLREGASVVAPQSNQLATLADASATPPSSHARRLGYGEVPARTSGSPVATSSIECRASPMSRRRRRGSFSRQRCIKRQTADGVPVGNWSSPAHARGLPRSCQRRFRRAKAR